MSTNKSKRVINYKAPDPDNTIETWVVRYGDPRDRKNRGSTSHYTSLEQAEAVYDRWVLKYDNVRIDQEWVGMFL